MITFKKILTYFSSKGAVNGYWLLFWIFFLEVK